MLAHIAIAVENVESASAVYRSLGFSVGEAEIVEREHVRVLKLEKDGLCIELLEAWPTGSGGVARFIAKRGPGLHHVALLSKDLVNDLSRLEKTGITPLSGYPAVGSNGTSVAFLNPKSTGGTLIELVQK